MNKNKNFQTGSVHKKENFSKIFHIKYFAFAIFCLLVFSHAYRYITYHNITDLEDRTAYACIAPTATPTPKDTDNDGVKDNEDVDLDGDGINNVIDENVDNDSFENSIDNNDDGDQIFDYDDFSPGGFGTTPDIWPISWGGNEPDTTPTPLPTSTPTPIPSSTPLPDDCTITAYVSSGDLFHNFPGHAWIKVNKINSIMPFNNEPRGWWPSIDNSWFSSLVSYH